MFDIGDVERGWGWPVARGPWPRGREQGASSEQGARFFGTWQEGEPAAQQQCNLIYYIGIGIWSAIYDIGQRARSAARGEAASVSGPLQAVARPWPRNAARPGNEGQFHPSRELPTPWSLRAAAPALYRLIDAGEPRGGPLEWGSCGATMQRGRAAQRQLRANKQTGASSFWATISKQKQNNKTNRPRLGVGAPRLCPCVRCATQTRSLGAMHYAHGTHTEGLGAQPAAQGRKDNSPPKKRRTHPLRFG
jgi:hypothetical protein